MPTITYADFEDVMNLAGGVSPPNIEKILDLAVDMLNLHGADLPNMSGTAGSKTLGLESKEKGAVFMAARAIYYGFYKGVEAVAVGGLTVGTSDLMSNPQVMSSIKKAARLLTEIEVDVG